MDLQTDRETDRPPHWRLCPHFTHLSIRLNVPVTYRVKIRTFFHFFFPIRSSMQPITTHSTPPKKPSPPKQAQNADPRHQSTEPDTGTKHTECKHSQTVWSLGSLNQHYVFLFRICLFSISSSRLWRLETVCKSLSKELRVSVPQWVSALQHQAGVKGEIGWMGWSET